MMYLPNETLGLGTYINEPSDMNIGGHTNKAKLTNTGCLVAFSKKSYFYYINIPWPLQVVAIGNKLEAKSEIFFKESILLITHYVLSKHK